MNAFNYFLSGLLFGAGLMISGMANPENVIGFLDIFGEWNPSLLFVMASAVSVGLVANVIRKKRSRPFIAVDWQIPSKTNIDRDLVIGATIFGIGWGLSGYCPGPGLLAAFLSPSSGLLFFISLIVGSYIFEKKGRFFPSHLPSLR
ncbi:DUF6691 family protein [Marinomonas balearica]|uniref:Sulphur transport domain-containing protein n=1 Tax=Marinomonas balearica TaxID=491947 RepID=A0A4R6M6C2_9GAMM|nr:DUF6691 family protein [Marinomonas balearica]TDO96927.1 hypothetical protein DFP79_2698 [Marinomonas balearica]